MFHLLSEQQNKLFKVFERLKLNDNYPYDRIIIVLENISDIDKFSNYFKEIEHNGINISGYIYDLLDHIKRTMENDNSQAYISFYTNDGKKLSYEWDDLTDMDTYQPREKYERLYKSSDIHHDFITNIMKYGSIVPNYKPKIKNKRILESFDSKKSGIIISIKNISEFNRLKRDLDEWKIQYDEFDDNIEEVIDDPINYPIDVLIQTDPNYYYIYPYDPFEDYDDVDFSVFNMYDTLFDFYNDDKAVSYVKNNGVIVPNYKPKQRPIREGVYNDINLPIYASSREQSVELEDFLHKNGFVYEDGEKYYISNEPNYRDMTIVISDINRKYIHARVGQKGYCILYSKYKNNIQKFIVNPTIEGLNNITVIKPNYTAKPKIIREFKVFEGAFHDNYPYSTIVVVIKDINEFNILKDYIENIFKLNIDSDDSDSISNDLKSGYEKYIRFVFEYNFLKYRYGSLDHLQSNISGTRYERLFTVDELLDDLIQKIMMFGRYFLKPKYEPKQKIKRTLESLNEDFFYDQSEIVDFFSRTRNSRLKKSDIEIGKSYNFKNDYYQIMRNISSDHDSYVEDNAIEYLQNNLGKPVKIYQKYLDTSRGQWWSMLGYSYDGDELWVYDDIFIIKKEPRYEPKQKIKRSLD